MSRSDQASRVGNVRRLNRIEILIMLIAVLVTAFAWTGLSVEDVIAALRF